MPTRRTTRIRIIAPALVPLLALASLLGACRAAPARYDSPDAAVTALVDALRPVDDAKLQTVLGADAKEITKSGDAVADQRGIASFLASYDERHEIVTEEDVATLVVGSQAWPFPIPLTRASDTWSFDTVAGREEILARRIGRNELYAIEVCRAIVDAQHEYATLDPDGDGAREFARRFLSEPGKRNGLYWPHADNEPISPLGELVASAAAEGYTRSASDVGPRPYEGYLYRILTAQGVEAPGGPMSYIVNGRMTEGFAIVAYPADYGNSGIMSFMVRHDGVLYEKDLGNRTERVCSTMPTFSPDADWTIVR